MTSKQTELNLVFRFTSWTGHREEWDLSFKDGQPMFVTITEYTNRGTPFTRTQVPAMQFIEEVLKWAKERRKKDAKVQPR